MQNNLSTQVCLSGTQEQLVSYCNEKEEKEKKVYAVRPHTGEPLCSDAALE